MPWLVRLAAGFSSESPGLNPRSMPQQIHYILETSKLGLKLNDQSFFTLSTAGRSTKPLKNSQSHVTSDSQSVSQFWYRARLGAHDQIMVKLIGNIARRRDWWAGCAWKGPGKKGREVRGGRTAKGPEAGGSGKTMIRATNRM